MENMGLCLYICGDNHLLLNNSSSKFFFDKSNKTQFFLQSVNLKLMYLRHTILWAWMNDSLWSRVLCLSTREQVLCLPFAGQNHPFPSFLVLAANNEMYFEYISEKGVEIPHVCNSAHP